MQTFSQSDSHRSTCISLRQNNSRKPCTISYNDRNRTPSKWPLKYQQLSVLSPKLGTVIVDANNEQSAREYFTNGTNRWKKYSELRHPNSTKPLYRNILAQNAHAVTVRTNSDHLTLRNAQNQTLTANSTTEKSREPLKQVPSPTDVLLLSVTELRQRSPPVHSHIIHSGQWLT